MAPKFGYYSLPSPRPSRNSDAARAIESKLFRNVRCAFSFLLLPLFFRKEIKAKREIPPISSRLFLISVLVLLLPKMRMLLAQFPSRVSQDKDTTCESSARNVSNLYFQPLPVWHFSAPKDTTCKSCARKIATLYFSPFRCFGGHFPA